MRQSRIDYGRLVEGALRGVVRDVLARAGREGIPAPHHFYVTFRTGAPGVVIPDFLRERYPVDMTIVLQHQFWDLEADADGFSVTLSFNDQLHRLRIPFSALKVFADPGVEFGLQFSLENESGEVTPLRPSTQAPPAGETEAKLLAGPAPAAAGRQQQDAADEEQAPAGGAEIVSLDRFRRK